MAQHALGNRLQIDRSTMVAVIDELEATGRVTRQRNPKNRRAYQLELTPNGRGTFQQAVRTVSAVLDDVLAPLDQTQREDLPTTLTTLLRHLGDQHPAATR